MVDRVLTVRLGADVAAYQRAMHAASGATLSVGTAGTTAGNSVVRSLGNAAKVGAALVTAAVGVGAAKVLSIGMAYESQMNTLQAVTQATSQKMEQVSATARAMGADLEIPGTSAADAAAAMTELAKGGLSVDQTMAAAKGTLQLAAAAQIEGGAAAEIQSNALNAFSLKASDASHVADVLANASNAASGEITDFAAGLAQSSAVASSFGISLDDTATVLGLFANRGIQGSDAGTSFKTMLIAMANPTLKAQAALDALGVTVHDSEGNFVGARVVTDQLSQAKARMTQAEFTSAAATAFGTDAMRAAVVMADGGTVAFDAMSTAVGRNGGAADLASAQMEGLSGALGVAQSGVEDVAIEFYERFSPAIEAAVRQAAERLPQIADAVFEVLDKVGAFAAELGPTVSAGLMAGASDLRMQAEQLLLPLVEGAKDLGTKAAPYVLEFGEKMWAALLKVGDAVAPVAKAVGEFFSTLADNGFVDGLGTALQALGTAMVGLGAALKPIGDAIGWVVDLISGVPGKVLLGVAAFTALALLGPMIQRMLVTVLAYVASMPLRIAVNMQIAAVATQRFMAALGPVGWVIAGLGTAMVLWGSQNDDAADAVAAHDARVAALAGTIDEATLSVTAATRASLEDSLSKDGTLKVLDALGVSSKDYVDGILAQEDANGKVAASMLEQGANVLYATDAYQKFASNLDDAGIAVEDITKAIATGDWSVVEEQLTAYNDALYKSGSTATMTIADLRSVGDEMGGFSDAYQGYGNQVGAVGETIESTRLKVEASAEAFQMIKPPDDNIWRSYQDGFGNVGVSLDGVVKSAAAVPAAVSPVEASIDALKQATEEADTAAQGLTISLDLMAGRTPDQDAQIRLMESSIRDYGSAIRDVPAAARDAAQATDDVKQAQIDLRTATDDLTKAQSHLNDGTEDATTLDEVTEAKLKEATARRGVKDAVQAEAEAKKSMKDSDDKLVESGREVFENAVKVASAAGNAEAALNGTGAGADAAAAAMKTARQDFIDASVAAGMTKTEAKKLADQIGLVPSEARTAFIANTDAAYATVEAWKRWAQDQVIRIPVIADGSGVRGLTATSYAGGRIGTSMGVPGFASGGGMLPGTPPSNPKQDNLLGISPQGIIAVRSREWLIKQETADAIGMRGMGMVNSGALNGLISAAAAGLIPAYASGGSPSLGTSASSLAGLAGPDYGDRLGRVVDALGDLADAVDEASERYRDARSDQAGALDDLNGVKSDAKGKRRDAAKKVADEEADLARVQKEQARKVADAKKKLTDTAIQVQEAEDRKVQAANDRLAEARNSEGKGRDERVAKANKAVSDAEAARTRAIDKSAKSQAMMVEKAERQQTKSVGFAERQLTKAQAAQTKAIAAGDKKVAAEQRQYDAAVKATRAAHDLAEASADLERKQARQRSRMKSLADTYDAVTDKLGKARDVASGLRDDRAQAAGSIASGLAGYGGGITGGNGLRMDAASIISGRTQNLDDIKAFGANIEQLRRKGLNAKSIQEIADAGVDNGGQTAAALAGASKSQIKQLNSLDAQILKSAQKTGNAVGDSLYKSGIQAADGIVAGLESRQKSIDKAMRKLGRSMAEAMKDALGIKSPSTVMRDQVGVQVVDGIMVGMDSRAGALNAQLDGLVKVPPVTFSNPADGVFSSYSGGGYGGSPSPSSVSVELRVGGDGQLAQFVRDHAEIIVNGALVKTAQVLVRAGGQG